MNKNKISHRMLGYVKRNKLLVSLLGVGGVSSVLIDKSTKEGLYRFTTAIGTGVQIMIDYKICEFKYPDELEYKEKVKDVHLKSARRVLDRCLKSGGLYIKAGQHIASMNHVLPKEWTETLLFLQDMAIVKHVDEIEKVFLKDFGNKINHYYKEFDEKPIAAASLAQVHRAVTKDGKEVAVKVQYPELQTNFNGDMATMSLLLKMVSFLFEGFAFGWMVKDVKEVLLKELNFELEAANSEIAAEQLKSHKQIKIPDVHWGLTSKRILTMEFIDGVKITDLKGLEEMGVSAKKAGKVMMEALAAQIFTHGFVHCDPHAGNILVCKDKSNPKNFQVVLLDHGLYQELTEKTRINFCQFFKAAVLADEVDMKKYANALGIENHRMAAFMFLMRHYEGALLNHLATPEQIEHGMELVTKNMGDFNECMKQMPQDLLLVLRNNNLLRATNVEMGVVVNRFQIMARHAYKGLFHQSNKDEIYEKLMKQKKKEEKQMENNSELNFNIMMRRNNIYSHLQLLYNNNNNNKNERRKKTLQKKKLNGMNVWGLTYYTNMMKAFSSAITFEIKLLIAETKNWMEMVVARVAKNAFGVNLIMKEMDAFDEKELTKIG